MSNPENITAVLGVLNNLELTRDFIEAFRKSFPSTYVAIGALGCNDETVGYLKDLQSVDDHIKVAYGPKDYKGSFSENFNVAINLVTTPKMVLVHNDMYFHKDFFKNLDEDLQDPELFLEYTTVEPLKNQGLPRPGKLVADFGESFSEFKEDEFNAYADGVSSRHDMRLKAYGFYLGGFTEGFREVGGFDHLTFIPSFCEDDDLQVRLKNKGFWIECTTRSICYHFGSQTSRKAFERGMSNLEVRSNRYFGRKWGFEARFLWKTGYENCKYLKVRDWKIAGYTKDSRDVGNMEPIMDLVALADGFDLEAYVKRESRVPEDNERIRARFCSLEDAKKADVFIEQKGQANFNLLSDIAGFLRLSTTSVSKGTFQLGPYEVTVNKDSSEIGYREDPKNYLSMLQK